MKTALVTGAGGFIGGHLVNRLIADGLDVRAVDIKTEQYWWQHNPAAENIVGDLGYEYTASEFIKGMDEVYALACDMGGMGFIAKHRADCMCSVLISTHTMVEALGHNAKVLYASSACVYPNYRQITVNSPPLAEADVYPAMPEDGYGWEKLFSERLATDLHEDYGLDVVIPRLHNVYGPHGEWTGERAKAPAAICRKVAEAILSGQHTIEIWGDGEQTRSFMYVDDAVEGFRRLMASDHHEPINLGSADLISINQLVTIIEEIAGVTLERTYDLLAPQGVRGRSSDNTRIRATLGWEPSTSLVQGLEVLYRWVEREVIKAATLVPSLNGPGLTARVDEQ